jgi:imidazolonepropionase-like amidohydrolase
MRFKLRWFAVFSLIALAISVQGCSPDEPTAVAAGPKVLVLTGFTLIDGTDRNPMPEMAMTIEAGHITWLGPIDQLAMPDNANTVDLSGKYVAPGFLDLHVHIGNTDEHALSQDKALYSKDSVYKSLSTYAAYGVTSVLVMGTDGDLIFNLRADADHQHPAMAKVFTAGQGIVFKDGYGGVPGLNHQVANVEEAQREVDAQAAKGVDVIKLWLDDELGSMPKMPPEISKAVIDAAHRHNLRTLGHIFYLEDAKRLAGQGIDGFVHLVRDLPVDDELIRVMKDRGIWQMGTLSREAALVAHGTEATYLKDPFFTRAVAADLVAQLSDPERQKKIATGPHYQEYKKFLENSLSNYKRLADAGVKYAMGTDSGPPGRFAGYSAHWELELMVQAGFTPQQALIAATSRAAEFLGKSDIGTVAIGNWADIVVMDANPLENIRNTRKLHSIYVGGRVVQPVNK